MQGPVQTSFGNVQFIQSQCSTPITLTQDPDSTAPGQSCTQIEHAAQAYHNYFNFLSTWSDISKFGNGSTELGSRPPGPALLRENTTITGSWVNIVDMATASKAAGRVINNVSLAMPHAGVSLAAYDGKNGILQPRVSLVLLHPRICLLTQFQDLDGLGVYNIRASVPSPVVDVLCANVEDSDIKDIVYSETPQGKRKPLNISTYPAEVNFTALNNFNITTPLDDIFGWGPGMRFTVHVH